MKNQVFNPLLPSYEYIPDAEPYVFNNRLYLFGSHDKFNGRNFCMNQYVSWSAPIDDLGNWKYEGIIYDKKKDPLYSKKNQFVLAPDIQKGFDNRYYLYYFLGFSSVISVAVSDHPAGEYQFYGHVKYSNGVLLGKRVNDPFMFDPAVIIDNNKLYLYTGFAPRFLTRLYLHGKGKMDASYVIELNRDMLTVKEKPKQLIPSRRNAKGTGFENHEFFEASSIRKFNDNFYFVYSSDHNHELCYAISKFPDKNFKYGGVIVSNADIGFNGRSERDALTYHGNNHGGLVQIENKFFIMYHRHTNRSSYSRQVCAEEIYLNNDGSITQVEMTSCGLNQGYLIGKGWYSAHIACNLISKMGAGSYSPLLFYKNYSKHPYLTQFGYDREDNPNQYIANIRSGSVVGFKYFLFNKLSQITVNLWGKAAGTLIIYLSLEGNQIASLPIIVNGNQETFSTRIEPLSGLYPLYFKYVGKGIINLSGFKLD